MSDAGTAVLTKSEQKPSAGAADTGQKRVMELRVTGHLMTLETGVFCVFQAPGPTLGSDETGLPGVRISLPPGLAGKPDAVSISTFRPDGWLSGGDAAALVRVSEGPAQVLVTVYQSPQQGPDSAPRLQVMRLNASAAAVAHPRTNGAAGAVAPSAEPEAMALVAHVQRTGDVGGKLGDWLGERGSKLWIEGFAVMPPNGIAPQDIEYQAVLGRGWDSPWMEGGKFCGSRGMALPLLGVRLRLKGDAARTHVLRYAASFVDGTEIGPVEAGESCETEGLAALEAIQVLLEPRVAARQTAPKAAAAAKPPAAPVVAAPAVTAKPRVSARRPPAPEAANAAPKLAAGKAPSAGKPAARPAQPAAPTSRRAR
jgi:hypothetical protein